MTDIYIAMVYILGGCTIIMILSAICHYISDWFNWYINTLIHLYNMELLKELIATGAITLENITEYLNSLGHTVLFDDIPDWGR